MVEPVAECSGKMAHFKYFKYFCWETARCVYLFIWFCWFIRFRTTWAWRMFFLSDLQNGAFTPPLDPLFFCSMLRSDAAKGNTSSTRDKLQPCTTGAERKVTDERLTWTWGKWKRICLFADMCNFNTFFFLQRKCFRGGAHKILTTVDALLHWPVAGTHRVSL